MTPFYFKRVELVEICLTKKTKEGHKLQDSKSVSQNETKSEVGREKEVVRGRKERERKEGRKQRVILLFQFSTSG